MSPIIILHIMELLNTQGILSADCTLDFVR